MATMTKMEKDTRVKELALELLNIPEGAGEIGAYTFAIPVGSVDGETRYAKVAISALNNKSTKTTAAFDFEERTAEWADEKAEKRKAAEEKAAAKAAKANSKK